jgi:hypothetical protein
LRFCYTAETRGNWIRSCDGEKDGLTILGDSRLRTRKVHDPNFGREHRNEESDGKDAIRDQAPFVTTNTQRPANVYHVESAHDSTFCVAARSGPPGVKTVPSERNRGGSGFCSHHRVVPHIRRCTERERDLFQLFVPMTGLCNLFV